MMPDRFATYLADTPQAEHLHHHLRYKVYCERKHYEEGTLADQIPQERDEYDDKAARFIIKDNYQGSWVGTARLVSNATHILPAQSLGAFDHTCISLLEKEPTAEVSRLATVSCYRSIDCTAQLLQNVILSAMGYSKCRGIEWLVFMVSPGLARILRSIGIPMEECGPKIEHRGMRRAYRSHVGNGIKVLPWARCLERDVAVYELFSRHIANEKALEAA